VGAHGDITQHGGTAGKVAGAGAAKVGGRSLMVALRHRQQGGRWKRQQRLRRDVAALRRAQQVHLGELAGADLRSQHAVEL